MNFPSRRKPLALFFCCGFVSVLVGANGADAQDQPLGPLRVDPALLGLPPQKPASAVATATDGVLRKNEPEVAPVEIPLVEPLPVVGAAPVSASAEKSAKTAKTAVKAHKASPEQIPARALAPQAAPAQVEPLPEPLQAAVATPTLAPPSRDPQAAPRKGVATVPGAVGQAPETQPEVPILGEAPAATNAAAVVPAPIPPSVDPAQFEGTRVDIAANTANEVLAQSVADSPVPGAGEASASVRVASETKATSAAAKPVNADKSWFRRLWDPVAYAYDAGDWEFYLPLVTYHSRSTYTQEQIDSYQERPLGFGIGKGYYNEKGNWEGVYALGFQDSHFMPSYTAGYGWKAIWRPSADVRFGLGYLAGLMTRSDTFNYFPFPIIVPLASVSYKNFSLEGTYIPPGGSAGNVLFFWAKWELGKPGEAVGTPARPAPVEAAAGALAQPSARVPYGPTLAAGAGTVGTVGTVGTTELPPIATLTQHLPVSVLQSADEVADPSPSLALRASPALLPQPKESAVPRPVFVSGLRMGGDVDREFNSEGDAELRKVGTIVNADRLTYWPIDDEMEAEGDVRLEQENDLITGPKMRLKLEDQIGYFEQPSYTIRHRPEAAGKIVAAPADTSSSPQASMADGSWFDAAWLNSGFASPSGLDVATGQTSVGDTTKMPKGSRDGRGDAERIDFEGENQYRLTRGSYTTCEPGNDDWYLKTQELKLDYDRQVADGNDGTLYFKDTPIFYSPWVSFSLNNERKSGFLAPKYGSTTTSGLELGLPYYWNIAPNLDATITPTVLGKRGVLLGADIGYLNTALGGVYSSKLKLDVLPDDRASNGDTRYGVSLQHNQTFANGWSGTINYNKVSDDSYFTDLSNNISSTSQVNLLQQATLTYSGGGWWNATANFQAYQTLQPDAANPTTYPYQMLPQITVNARQPDLFMTDSTFLGQYTNFTIKDRVQNGTIYPDGQRTVLYPQVALPYVNPGWYVTPKIGVNVTNYALSGQASGVPDTLNRTLPIFSVDSGMTFERPSNWFGRDYTQTLEPRFYYLNIPYKDQSQIPIFDTGLADFNFAQIFSENQFSSWDRVSNANQLTAAVTTRLLEPDTGNEVMRVMLGERLYFEQSKVTLPGATTSAGGKWDKSDWLAAFSGQILPKVYLDSALQYNLSDQEVKRFSAGTRYQPEPGKVLNLGYQYYLSADALSQHIDQANLTGQWPISGGWYGVGQLNYSFKDYASDLASSVQKARVIQAIAGLEYNGGCWVVRGVLQRIALTESSASTGIYLQLELSDFSRIGNNPLDILKNNIQGYSLINQPTGSALSGQ